MQIPREAERQDALAAAVTGRTRVLVVSHVHSITGTCLDLDRLGQVCRGHDALFVVDGIHALGAVPVSLTHVDAYMAGVFKWMLAGFGPAEWFDEAKRRRYHEAWRQPGALTGMVNWYRATPMHPPTPTDPGAARLVLDPDDVRVRVPTRVIWGMDDTALLPVLLDGLETMGDDLRVTRIDGVSHWLIHEAPARIGAEIRLQLGH